MAFSGRSDPEASLAIDEQDRREFADLGVEVPDDMIEDGADVFHFWDINEAAVEAFLALATQWRVVARPNGLAEGDLVWLGLDYAAVDAMLTRFGHAGRALFDDIRVMERAALAIFKQGD